MIFVIHIFISVLKELKASWVKDAKMFADNGLDIAKTLNVEDHLWARRWAERGRDHMKFSLRENVQCACYKREKMHAVKKEK